MLSREICGRATSIIDVIRLAGDVCAYTCFVMMGKPGGLNVLQRSGLRPSVGVRYAVTGPYFSALPGILGAGLS